LIDLYGSKMPLLQNQNVQDVLCRQPYNFSLQRVLCSPL
jgi:hypothetical protein